MLPINTNNQAGKIFYPMESFFIPSEILSSFFKSYDTSKLLSKATKLGAM
jgi:hypothetical protein